MRSGQWLGLCWIAVALAAANASAYTSTVTTNGKLVKWGEQMKLNLLGNPSNHDGFDSEQFRDAVVRGLQRWSAALDGKFHFDYWQGTDTSRYPPNSEFNGVSSIYFASSASKGTAIPSTVLGLTQVWYNTDTGQILETDIQLNDLAFEFTNNVRDTTGFGNSGGLFRSKVYIENVITHELGHAVGLSHSANLQSTMLFMESPEQAHLSCDELIGVNAHYFGNQGGTRGTIRGRVVGPDAKPVFGAYVQAVSRVRGVALAGSLTGPDGNYVIDGLEPGDYFLTAEPFRAGLPALPQYYDKINVRICDGREFSRSFLYDGARPAQIQVKQGDVTHPPDIYAACMPTGAAAVTAMPASASLPTAPTLREADTDPRQGFGIIDDLKYANPAFYKLKGISGKLELHTLSYSLYSPVRANLVLLDSTGAEVPGVVSSSAVYRGDSGYVNFDSALLATDLPAGDYTLRVESALLQSTLYPAGQILLDPTPFILITGGLNDSDPPLEKEIPVNARCRTEENFPRYVSPPEGMPAPNGQSGGGGFCSPVASEEKRGPEDAAQKIAWFLPWFAMLAGLTAMRYWSRLRSLQ